MKGLIWPLISWSAWALQSSVVMAGKMRALLWRLFDRSARAYPNTVLADTTAEGAAMASVLSVVVGLTCPCGDSTTDEGAAKASIRLSGWTQPATVVAGPTGEGAALASVRLPGEGSASQFVGGHVI